MSRGSCVCVLHPPSAKPFICSCATSPQSLPPFDQRLPSPQSINAPTSPLPFLCALPCPYSLTDSACVLTLLSYHVAWLRSDFDQAVRHLLRFSPTCHPSSMIEYLVPPSVLILLPGSVVLFYRSTQKTHSARCRVSNRDASIVESAVANMPLLGIWTWMPGYKCQ